MRKRQAILFTGIMMLAMLRSSYAEEDKYINPGIIELEPIIVTSLRSEKNLCELPSAASVVTKKEIENSGAKNIPQLLKSIVGIYTYDASGVGTGGKVDMRGFYGGMSSHQLVLLDGIPQNKGKDKLVDWDLISLDNIERVEIIKGPAMALYGDNVMSGVINIITKKPTIDLEGEIGASYGSYDTQAYEISISGPLKKTDYNFAISRKTTDGFRRHGDYEKTCGNFKMNYFPDEKQDFNLSLDYIEKENGAYPWAITEVQIEQDRRQARPGTQNDKSENTKSDMSLTYNRHVTDAMTTSGTFYYRYEDGNSFYTGGATANSTKEQLENEDAYGLLLRLNAGTEIFKKRHSFIAGVDMEKDDLDYEEYSAPYQLRGRLVSDYAVEREKAAPYIQDEIEVFEPLKFITGMRYDWINFDFSDYKNQSASKEREMTKWTCSNGIVYSYKENSSLYANYAQAFRTPTVGQMFTYGSFSNPDLNPEKAVNYEAGLRHCFRDYLKTDVSLYWMEVDSEIWYDAAAQKYKNCGGTSHKGLEAALDYKIIKNLCGFLNYAYTRAKNENGDFDGKYLTNIPLQKGGLGIELGTDFGLKTNLAVTAVGSSYIDSTNTNKLASYTTVDTKIIYEHEPWSWFLAVDNVLDRKYNLYGYVGSQGVRYFNPAPPRAYTAGMKVKF